MLLFRIVVIYSAIGYHRCSKTQPVRVFSHCLEKEIIIFVDLVFPSFSGLLIQQFVTVSSQCSPNAPIFSCFLQFFFSSV